MSGGERSAARGSRSSATSLTDATSGATVGKGTRVTAWPSQGTSPREEIAISVVEAARVILKDKKNGHINRAAVSSYGPLMQLYSAVVGNSVLYPEGMTPPQQLALFDMAVAALQPWVQVANVKTDDGLNEEWVRSSFTEPVRELRAKLVQEATHYRVQTAVMSADRREAAELPDRPLDDQTAPEYGKALLGPMDSVLASLKRLEGVRSALELTKPDPSFVKVPAPREIAYTISTLTLLRSAVALDGAWEKAAAADTRLEKLTSYTELVRTALESTKAGVTMAANLAGALQLRAGRPDLAQRCFKIAEKAGEGFGIALAGANMIHGIAVMHTAKNSGEMLEGAVEFTAGGLGLAGAALEVSALGVAGALVGAAGVFWALQMSAYGWAGNMMAEADLKPRFKTLMKGAIEIAIARDHLIKAQLLLATQTDPVQNAYFAAEVVRSTDYLDRVAEGVLGQCLPGQREDWMPGGNVHIAEMFARYQGRPPATTPDAALKKAKLVLIKIQDVFEDAPNLARLTRGLRRAVPE